MMMKEMMMMIDRNKGNLTLGGVSNKSSIRQVLVLLFLKSWLVQAAATALHIPSSWVKM